MSSKHKIVIIGGGYAGVMAALRLAGKAGADAEVTLINGREELIHRIRNHQVAAQQEIQRYSIRKLLGKRPVRFVQGWVTSIDLQRHFVQMDNGKTVAYDKLVYALGSVAGKPDIPGVSEYSYAVANIDEAETLRERVASLPAGAQAIVIGGGLTGIETATELAEIRPDLRVRLVTDGVVGQGLSEAGRAYLRQTFAELNLALEEETRVQQMEADRLLTNQGRSIPFDVAIWAGPFGVPGLARESGLAVNAAGRVQVDSRLRSISHPDVYAVGDSSVIADRVPLRMACATAFSTGAHAADNLAAWIAGEPQQPFGFHYGGQCISLGRKRAMVQLTDKNDAPQERIVTGLPAKLLKEGICRGTILGLKLERMMPGMTRWPGRNSAPAERETRQVKPAESY